VADDHIRTPIIGFLESRFPGIALEPTEDIFARGFVNSLFAMELVLFLENTFAFTVPSEVLQLDNFRTVASMAALVERHVGVVEGASAS
jgi:acyl carrier protein